MGLNITEIVPRKEIQFSDLKNKILAVDAFNTIYQFLSTIRQPDGTPLMDKKQRVTSHLSGLFYRNINLLREGIKMIYVFDGKASKLKAKTHEKRKDVKEVAFQKYEKAKQEEDIEEMGKYARQLASIDEEKIKESKELLESMGIPCVQASGEGEAQASYLSQKKEVYATASQDYDSLLFGSPVLIQNLTLSRKRKTFSGYTTINPELIELERVLNSLQINYEQLICLGILVGTDYNPGGIKGIGPKKALALVRQKKAPTLIFKEVEAQLSFDWQEIFEMFKKPNITPMKYEDINFPKLNQEKIKEILLEHDFSEERINSGLEKLNKAKEEQKQRTLF